MRHEGNARRDEAKSNEYPVSAFRNSGFRVSGTLSRNAGLTSRFQVSGFTLVELMTVIAIIGILAGLVLGVAGYATRKADRSRAITDMNKLQNALEEYRLNRSCYPSNYPSWNSITAVSDKDFFTSLTNSLPNDFDQSELHRRDPWENSYWYQCQIQSPGQHRVQYRLWSTGPDSLDPGDDITPETGGL